MFCGLYQASNTCFRTLWKSPKVYRLAQQVPLRGTSIMQETLCKTSLIEPSFSPSRRALMQNKRPMLWYCFRKKSIITIICLEHCGLRIQPSISVCVLIKLLLHSKVELFRRAWYKMQLTLFILQSQYSVSISTCHRCKPK